MKSEGIPPCKNVVLQASRLLPTCAIVLEHCTQSWGPSGLRDTTWFWTTISLPQCCLFPGWSIPNWIHSFFNLLPSLGIAIETMLPWPLFGGLRSFSRSPWPIKIWFYLNYENSLERFWGPWKMYALLLLLFLISVEGRWICILIFKLCTISTHASCTFLKIWEVYRVFFLK